MIPPHFEQTGTTSGRILFGDECVAEIREMSLYGLRLEPGGSAMIGNDVPLPLYWRQYAHHEDPERSASSNGRVSCVSRNGDRMLIRCEGTNANKEIRSVYTVEFRFDADTGSYVLDVQAQLEVLPGKTWRVTYNPSHGEVEFCNFWPAGTYSTHGGGLKAYSTCFVERGSAITLIPHHHIESSDKHNILLRKHDRFGWLLENENPVIQLLSEDEASVGLCAYMWDAHIAYRACTTPGEMLLPSGTHREAAIRLTRLSRHEAAPLLERGTAAEAPELDTTPIYVHGLNTFRRTMRSFPQQQDVWPWTFEVVGRGPGTEGTLDKSVGYDDNASLRVASGRTGSGLWSATTLGPAFNGPPFTDGKRYRLTSMVRTELLDGSAHVGVRLHREGSPNLGNARSYEHFWSERSCSGTSPWTLLEVRTPLISPRPDRMHLLLRHDGRGISWFDNVLLEHD